MDKYYFIIIVILGVMMFLGKLFYGTNKSQEKFTKEYNKKHKTNFKNHRDLKAHLHLREMSRILEQNKIIEKERKEEEAKERKEEEQERLEKEQQKEERITASEPSSSDLGARLKKLRQMYKDGILSKVEFEKAKNKLLK